MRKGITKCVIASMLAMELFCATASDVTVTVKAETEFTESKTIWVIGDSISSDHNDEDNLKENKVPITGWGNVLQNYVSSDVKIENKARSGRSAKSYTTEQVYKEVMKKVQAGDYVIIQFGHNDEKKDIHTLYSDPSGSSDMEGSYKWYLKNYYIEPNFEKGARTILASSVVRCTFKDGGLGEQTHEAYAKAMKELAKEYQEQGKEVYFIDTFNITKDLYEQIGEEKAKKMHAVIGQDPDSELDTTHYGPYGAMYMGGVMAKELKALGIACCQDIKTAKIADSDAAKNARTSAKKFDWR